MFVYLVGNLIILFYSLNVILKLEVSEILSFFVLILWVDNVLIIWCYKYICMIFYISVFIGFILYSLKVFIKLILKIIISSNLIKICLIWFKIYVDFFCFYNVCKLFF